MNPISGAHDGPSDDSEPDDSVSPLTGTAVRPQKHDAQSKARPLLARRAPGRLSEITETSPDSSNTARPAVIKASGSLMDSRRPSAGAQGPSTEAERLANVRDAVNAKLLLAQERRRGSYGTSTTTGMRVSPIAEEEGHSMSPSLAAAFASPPENLQPLSTISTESNSSSKTVRASVPATPNDTRPLRTPSYPFPVVPGIPRTWPSPLHQPFTVLSPTETAKQPDIHRSDTSRGSPSSILSTVTPTGNTRNFLPPEESYQGSEDPRYPTPNLYDVVLQLNAEPGIEQWWTAVTNLMHDQFKAERVTLIVPLDPTDIENVPWGQKAAFNMCGREEFVSRRMLIEQQTRVSPVQNRAESGLRDSSADVAKDTHMRKLHPERLRPRLESRHSYAGHGRDTKEHAAEPSLRGGARPAGPQRTMTHAAGVAGGVGPGRLFTRRPPSSSTSRYDSFSDPDFSSIAGGVDAGPYTEVFPTLRDLDSEQHPLIESGGVNRVLGRGRVVAVTRDYASEDEVPSERPLTAYGHVGLPEAKSHETIKSATEKLFGNYRGALVSGTLPPLRQDYQEYEQHPASPWSQSPAPSPAIQSDEEENPFFASDPSQQVEDSFNPTTTPREYTRDSQVEAIGVDQASTVIHIPLVHPVLSSPMQSLRMYRRPEDRSGMPHRSNTIDLERKAPVAIISVLSPMVPYPQNLLHAIQLLGPHLATSFATAQQFSSVHQQTLTDRQRQFSQGYALPTGAMTEDPIAFDNIARAGYTSSSMTDSVTSPSDYSGRSKHSPSGSIVGTPGWESAAQGWTASHSATGTPHTGAETVENYFETKRRSGQRSGSNASLHLPVASSTPVRATKTAPTSDTKTSGMKLSSYGDDDQKSRTGDQKQRLTKKVKVEASAREESPPLNPTKGSSTGQPQDMDTGIAKRHTLLHSYGADFEASFGGDLAGRSSTEANSEEMPPPSERLLRTIIDSVPVQIFTASPDTGQLSWVNSKYLIYRGQESRQVLQEPWDAIHPDDRSEFTACWQRSLRTAQQLQQKVRLKRFDGTFRWFYVRAAPLKDKRLKIVHWIGTMMDFHEQHLAETNAARQQETEASEAKYRALANSSPQIVFTVSRGRGITFCNSQWVHYSGQTEVEALGVGFMSFVHPEDLVKCSLPTFDEFTQQPTNVPTTLPYTPRRTLSASGASSSGSSETERADMMTSPVSQMPQRQLSELASTGILKVTRDADGKPSYSTEVRLRSKEGDFRWHLVRVLLADATIRDNPEETWYGTCTDINDHKTLERELKETMDDKSRFLSNMSHEIRTPLNGITGMVNFLIDSSLTAEQMEHVNIIRASTEGLRGLINDILDLSKAEAGMIQLNMDWLYIRALLEEVNDLTSAMATDKGLELNYLVEENVPSQVKGDRPRLRQILLNIIGNAIKFTQSGEVFIRCSVMPHDGNTGEEEIYIKFDVVDTGRGFTEREAEFLFKRFSQIDGSSTRQHGGTGLGLVISRQLAQLHGGDMLAKGVPGKGATFTFMIRASLPSAQEQPPPPPSTPGMILPEVPILPGPLTMPGATQKPTKVPSISGRMQLDNQPRLSPRVGQEHNHFASPITSPDRLRESPLASSASSDPSVRSEPRTSSIRSTRSSASSFVLDTVNSKPMALSMPSDRKMSREDKEGSSASPRESQEPGKPTTSAVQVQLSSPGGTTSGQLTPPPMYSILVVCPLKYSREATVQHIDMTLPKNIPHQITAREHLLECQKILGGDDPVIFTHIVVVLQHVAEITALLDQVFSSPAHHMTAIVIITDLGQRRKIMEQAPGHNYTQLTSERRLQFVFKPLKPSRFAIIFDPQKEREMSTDRNQDSAQQVALSQKQVFAEVGRRLGDRDMRVLLVEDNKVNQMVSYAIIHDTKPECALTKDLGHSQILRQGVDPGGHGHGRRAMHGQGLRPSLWILLDHPLRSPHAQQGRVPDVQGNPEVGASQPLRAPAHHRAVGQRPGRRLPEVRRRRLQQLHDQACRLQGAEHRPDDFHGPHRSLQTSRVHENKRSGSAWTVDVVGGRRDGNSFELMTKFGVGDGHPDPHSSLYGGGGSDEESAWHRGQQNSSSASC